ncbi:short-chain fatty acyl-CoA regulator family protein [Stappia sp.]|uniref:helix-turn-helix domain-containing protein n=1 Tax=Stappia sp. TaxID=1870903 RepID=UPI0032D96571
MMKKLFLGRQIRALREKAALTQRDFAERLGLSTSYVNQLENNQRPVSAPVLLSLSERFGLDISALSVDENDRLLAALQEVFADPVFAGAVPGLQDFKMVCQNAPDLAHGLVRLHQAYRQTSEQLVMLDATLARNEAAARPTPYEEVRDFFHFENNYIHDLDVAAEALSERLTGTGRVFARDLVQHLEAAHGVSVERRRAGEDSGQIRTYDGGSRRLVLNEALPEATIIFQLAHQIALLEATEIIDDVLRRANFQTEDAVHVARIGLANAFAGALVLPYKPFLRTAQETRHDLDLIADRFGASLEQVAHRLSTLQRPRLKGIPFFFARVDRAGNITKRHSATRLQFARFGAACPLWNVHRAFEAHGTIIRQLAETPDGSRYISLAAHIVKKSGGFSGPVLHYAIALGTEIAHAREIVYCDDLDVTRDAAFEPIGISCRICERLTCPQRSVPPLNRPISIDSNKRGLVPYAIR